MSDSQVLFAHNEIENTSASTTWVDGATISAGSFTAGKEYLIIAICKLKTSATTSFKGARLVHGTTPTEFTDADSASKGVNVNERNDVGAWLFRFTQPGTPEDVNVQFNRKAGSGTITQMLSAIIAIKLSDDFVENTDFFWNEATSDVSDAASMTDRASVTFTPNGTDRWLIIGQAAWDIANTAVNFAMRIHDTVGPVNYGDDGTFGYPSQDTDDLYNFLYLVGVTPSNASHTFSVQTISATTQTVRSSRIIAINLSKFAQNAVSYTSASDTPNTDPTWETEASASPTPTNTGDWVVLATTLPTAAGAVNLRGRLQIDPDGGGLVSDPNYGDDGPNVGGGSGRAMPWALITKRQLNSGTSRAINFDWTITSGTPTVRERVLVAFSVALAAAAAASPPFDTPARNIQHLLAR